MEFGNNRNANKIVPTYMDIKQSNLATTCYAG